MTTRPGQVGLINRFSPRYPSPRPRRREVPRLVMTMLLLAFMAAGCSSAADGSAASSPASGTATGSAGTTSLSQVTLHIGDEAGSGAQALLTAAGLIH